MTTFLTGLVFLLLGVLAGGALCVRYLRREVAGDIGPKLRHLQLQLETIEAELSLALTIRQAELGGWTPGNPPAGRENGQGSPAASGR